MITIDLNESDIFLIFEALDWRHVALKDGSTEDRFKARYANMLGMWLLNSLTIHQLEERLKAKGKKHG